MCGKECSENEECRYDKENCEYECVLASTTIVMGASGLVASLAALFFL